MILCDYQIKAEVSLSRLKISPYDWTLINPSSLDVRLGSGFSVVSPTYINIDPTNNTSFTTKEVGTDKYILKPGQMVLGRLLEDIGLPNDISASLRGKSSLARLGLDNSSFGAWIDPGFKGSLVIELANHNSEPLLLTSGMKIGQLIFYKHVPCEQDYGHRASSKYMNQKGVQGSKGV